MPVKALQAVSSGRNGLKTFILPCTRLSFHYSDWAGSSKGMNAFLKHTLPKFAASHPSIEIVITPLPGKPTAHPFISASYVNGRTRWAGCRNLEPGEILKKARMLRDGDGSKDRRDVGHPVASLGGENGEGVRGVWSGLHADKTEV